MIEYTIKWGDRLYQIAKFHGVKVQDILNVNPQITNPDYIISGHRILIPTSKSGLVPNKPLIMNDASSRPLSAQLNFYHPTNVINFNSQTPSVLDLRISNHGIDEGNMQRVVQGGDKSANDSKETQTDARINQNTIENVLKTEEINTNEMDLTKDLVQESTQNQDDVERNANDENEAKIDIMDKSEPISKLKVMLPKGDQPEDDVTHSGDKNSKYSAKTNEDAGFQGYSKVVNGNDDQIEILIGSQNNFKILPIPRNESRLVDLERKSLLRSYPKKLKIIESHAEKFIVKKYYIEHEGTITINDSEIEIRIESENGPTSVLSRKNGLSDEYREDLNERMGKIEKTKQILKKNALPATKTAMKAATAATVL